MGVIYKLKQEVIDFILSSKDQDPNLSCRHISALATEKFQTVISKSSVNNVLQKAEKSSSVGRRNLYETFPKKFMIPKDKKDLLHKIFKTTSLDEKGDLLTAGTIKIEPVLSRKNENKKLLESKQKELLGIKEETSSLPVFVPDPIEEILLYSDLKMKKCKAEEFLFKIGLYDLFDREFLEQAFGNNVSIEDIEKQVLLTCRDMIHNENHTENISSALTGISIDDNVYFGILERLLMVDKVQLIFDDGRKAEMDAPLSHLSFSSTKGLKGSFFKTVGLISKIIVSNKEVMSAQFDGTHEDLLYWMDFCCKKRSLKEIVLLNEENESLLNIPFIPQLERKFLIKISDHLFSQIFSSENAQEEIKFNIQSLSVAGTMQTYVNSSLYGAVIVVENKRKAYFVTNSSLSNEKHFEEIFENNWLFALDTESAESSLKQMPNADSQDKLLFSICKSICYYTKNQFILMNNFDWSQIITYFENDKVVCGDFTNKDFSSIHSSVTASRIEDFQGRRFVSAS